MTLLVSVFSPGDVSVGDGGRREEEDVYFSSHLQVILTDVRESFAFSLQTSSDLLTEGQQGLFALQVHFIRKNQGK